VWDEQTKTVVTTTNLGRGPKPIVAKNIKMKALISNSENEKPSSRLQNLRSAIKPFKKVILFCDQYGISTTPPMIFEAIRKAPKDWIWLIRLHPLNKPLLSSYYTLLQNEGISNFEIDLCNTLSAYECLKLSDHVVTSFSTSAFEAICLDIPCTVISNLGYQTYESYIHSGRVFFASKAERLINQISEANLNKLGGLIPKSDEEIRQTFNAMLEEFNRDRYSKARA